MLLKGISIFKRLKILYNEIILREVKVINWEGIGK